MSLICPVCNGIYSLEGYTCSNCNSYLEDQGPVTNFLGPYSPYQEKEETAAYCVHLISCPVCGYDERITVNLVRF